MSTENVYDHGVFDSVFAGKAARPAGPLRFSPRERQLVRLVAQGYSNQEIADGLGLSLQTVKNHLSRVYRKLGISTRVQLAVFVVGSGLDIF